MFTLTNKQKESLTKSAIAGGLLCVYGNAPVNVMGYNVPAAVPLFVAGAGASLATDVILAQDALVTSPRYLPCRAWFNSLGRRYPRSPVNSIA
jgi:hypothetical protein